MKQPAVVVFVNFSLGVIVSHFFHYSFSFLSLVLLCAAFLILLILILRAGRAFTIAGFCVSFGLGFLWMGFAQFSFEEQSVSKFTNVHRPVGLLGVVRSIPQIQHNRLKWTIRAEKIFGRDSISPTRGNVLVSSKELNTRIQIGERIFMRGYLGTPSGRRNPGGFDYRAYLTHRGISALFYPEQGVPYKTFGAESGNRFRKDLIAPLRTKISAQLTAYLGQTEEASLLKGFLLGQRGQIDPDIQNRFAKTGVIHVLAVSGLHVGFILVLMLGILKWLRLREFPRTLLIILGLIFYVYLTGGKPPVVRASLMAVIILIGYLVQRRPDVINSLAVAALLLLLVNPFLLFDAGFQLSFLAVLGIVLFYNRLMGFFQFQPKNKWQHFFREKLLPLLIVSFAAQLGTLPLTLYYFHRLPTYALLANIVVIPLVFIIVTFGFAMLIAGAVWPVLGMGIAWCVKIILTFLIQFVTFFSNLPGSTVESFGRFSIWHFLVYLVLLGLVWYANEPKRVRRFVLALFFLWVSRAGVDAVSHLRPELKVTFLDVGQGDGSVVELPDGHVLVIDAGPRQNLFDSGRSIVFPFLRDKRLNSIDALMISHHHKDHAGGVPFLIAHMPVGEVWDNGDSLAEPIYRLYRREISEKKIPLRAVSAGYHKLNWQGVSLWIFYPLEINHRPGAADPANIENNHSVVAKICFGRRSFLFTGDIEARVEQKLIRFGELLKSDVLKMPHHGSRTSGTLAFLKTVAPQVAVISVAARNRFHQPSEEVLERLRNLNIRICRTDREGAIEFKTDGKTLKKTVIIPALNRSAP
ncbi:comEC family competence protein [bacterium BMS3Bbin03]|nr:comEC family competence protein [bacterium BMS3Bbin03]